MSDDQQYVTVRSAATSVGIPERTIRYWISEGKFAATAGKRGKLVSMRDVLELATLSGKDTAGSATAKTSADGKPGNTAESLPSVTARSQLEAVRDEWLAPLIEQITDQAETIGRLTAELEYERQRGRPWNRVYASVRRKPRNPPVWQTTPRRRTMHPLGGSSGGASDGAVDLLADWPSVGANRARYRTPELVDMRAVRSAGDHDQATSTETWVAILEAGMSEQRASQWAAIDQRVEHHRQAQWLEIQRWEDPPRVRVRKGRPGYRGICRDITIGDDGDVVWFPVDCGAD